jgi:hypothetical protein
MNPWKTLSIIFAASCSHDWVTSFAPTRPVASFAVSRSPAVILNAEKNNRKKKKNDSGSLEPLLKFVFPSKSSNPVGSGIETALMLIDKRRQEEFKKEMLQNFPFVPPGVMDTCVTSLADSFSAVAPSKLKTALKPGGLEKVRPELEDTIVASLQDQSMIKDLPLTKSDKGKLLKYMVRLSLDYLLQDVQEMLKQPTERLQLLDDKKQQIQRYMTFWQLTWYRIRYYPIQMTLIGAATAMSSIFLYQQYRKTALAAAVTSTCLSIVAAVKAPLVTLKALALSAAAAVKDHLSKLGLLKTAKKGARRIRR